MLSQSRISVSAASALSSGMGDNGIALPLTHSACVFAYGIVFRSLAAFSWTRFGNTSRTLVNLCPAPRLLPGGMEFPEHGSDTHVSIDHYEL